MDGQKQIRPQIVALRSIRGDFRNRDCPLEEECFPEYHSKSFYHANPGEVLDGRFELKAKVGYGRTSTVWLAQIIGWRRSLQPEQYVVIKICDNRSGGEDARHELDISNHIASSASGDSALDFIRLVKDNFEISSPHGQHLCLVFEPMRESIWLLRRRFGADKVMMGAIDNFKHFIRNILEGLSVLHSKCHIIHTDLKLDNILVTVEDQSILDEFVQAQAEQPMAQKSYEDRVVYRSNNLLGLLKWERFRFIWPKITDFGLAQRHTGQPQIIPIQPRQFCAPEVLLGTGWSYSADIWNFGLMVWALLGGRHLFQQICDEYGRYSARHHLAEMIALLGPIAPELVEQEKRLRNLRWAPDVLNDNGVLCNSVAGFFGGPFLDNSGILPSIPLGYQRLIALPGRFVGEELIPADRDMKTMVPDCISPDQVDIFLDFMISMLRWLPGDRSTAEELLKHQWLRQSDF
ncbi:MAG: hypothetical protein M1820_004051 [Bogoriella megaspora]|nr:MAG: hypothetical protein M1820_004051 [Bogoriella megaspora]